MLQASKLLEGRITIDQLSRIDISNFDLLVENEFKNIEDSLKLLKEKGIVTPYTKDERNFDSKIINELGKS